MTDQASNRVADAPADIWVYRLLPQAIWPYAQLARWDRPIGWWLLLWPCWWSFVLSFGLYLQQQPITLTDDELGPFYLMVQFAQGLFFFWLGAVMMRGAGCTYNDFVDARIDAKVARTASRPIPSGRVTRRQSAVFMAAQAFVGLICLLGLCLIGRATVNEFALFLGISSLVIVAAYPFAKRITDWPQLVLGLAFSWGALMGWAVIFANLTLVPILLYIGSIMWVIGYDTIYAHQDKEDDALIGVRSTARLFGERTKPALVVLYSGTLALLATAFWLAGSGWPAYLGLVLGCGHMIWQVISLNIDDADNCLALFQSNTLFGWLVFVGLLIDLVF